MPRSPRLVVWSVVLLALVLIGQRPRVEAQQQGASPVKVDDVASAPQAAPVPLGSLVPPGQKWTTSLSPNQEVPLPSGAPTGRGTGWVVLNAAETQITVFMLYGGLTSNAILAHIHGNATSTVGVNGPIIFDLGVTAGPSGTNVNTTFAITPAQVALLRANLLYINVHSVNNPSGEIRGQLHLLDAAFNADFDGQADAAVFRPSDRVWYVFNSDTNTLSEQQWGAATDLFVPGDYDGDGRLDAAIWRPTNGVWFIRSSQTGNMIVHLWGSSQDIPVPADYDKDGRTDPAIFRPATGEWYLLRSTAGPIGFTFGTMGDRPVAGDFDGDGRADIAVQRPGSNWYVFTAAGEVLTFTLNQGDTPLVPGDYTGDGRTDVGQFNPATGIWRFMDGSNGSPFLHFWGGPGDLPVAGDYDSDGRVDLGVFRPSDGRWYVRFSLTGTLGIVPWGTSEDVPLPSMFTMPSVVPTAVGDTATVDEDSGATAIDVLANDTDPDGGLKRIFEVTPPAYGAAVITGNGTGLTYQPNPDYCGPDAFTYTLWPGGLTATVLVTVTCIDDAPVAVNDSATVNEDSAANPINVLANDTDIDSGPMTIDQVTQPANGIVAITGGGTELTYQPNADYCGSDSFTYTLAPGTSTATVSVTVLCANDAPVATDDALSSIAEDSAPRIIPFATLLANDVAGPPSEAGQTLTITGVTNPVGGTVIIVATDVVFTPAANYNGPASFGYTVADNGETGGVPDPQTDTGAVTFTITEVNDAPVATDDVAPTVLEDTGPHSISLASILSNDTVGATSEEASQSLTVSGVTNPVGGTVMLSGADVVFTLTPDFSGTASFDYTIQDNGTTDGAPDPLTDVGTVTFTVTPVNDAPSFVIGGNPAAVNEDAGAQSVPSFATSISAGPNETGQVLTFVIDSNSNPTLFSAGPSISATGTLTYTPAANQNGAANIQVRLDDDGGTANGGDNQSDPVNFTITVNAVNDAPVASNKIASAQTNMQVSIPNLLVGTTDADDGVNGCSPTFTLAGAGPTTSPLGGSVTITNATTGTVDFNPPPGVTGIVTFSYTVSDDGCPGTATSAAATVSVTVNGPVIWFVNSAAPAGGNGRLTNPFNTLAGADAVDAAGHRIFLYTGTYTQGLTMQSTEWLVGQGATGTNFDTLMGITPPSGTIPRPAINGARPTVSVGSGTAITLSSGNTVRGLNVTNSTGSGITGSAVGTLTLADFDVTVAGGSALSLTTSGTVSATGTDNDLSSTTGTALNVANVSIGAAGLTFKSIAAGNNSAAADPVNGIVLTNTGALGGLTVTGTGADNSGGVIQNTTGDGILLSSVQGVALTQMKVLAGGDNNLDATNVTGLMLSSFFSDFSANTGFRGTTIRDLVISNGSVFDHSGNAAVDPILGLPEDGVFITDLLGTSSVTNTEFRRSAVRQFAVRNLTATVAQPGTPTDVLTMSGITFANHDNTTSAFFSDNLQIAGELAANMKFVVDNTSGANAIDGGIDGILVNASSGADINVKISNVTVTNGTGPGINFNPTGAGTRVWFDVHNNTITNRGSIPLSATAVGNDAIIEGFFTDNVVTTSVNASGIVVITEGDGDNTDRPTATIRATNNTITGVQNGSGISAQARVGGIVNLTLDNNHVNIDNLLNLEGVFVQSGSNNPIDNDADTINIVRLNMFNNDTTVGATSGQEDYRFQVRGLSFFELQDFTGNGVNQNDVTDWIVAAKNNRKFDGVTIPAVQITRTAGGLFSASAGAIPTPVVPARPDSR